MEKITYINKFIPTIGNLPASYDESLSYLQMLMLYRKNLTTVINKVNDLINIVNTIDYNFEDIYNKINQINLEIDAINNNFSSFQDSINANVQQQLTQFEYEINTLLNNYNSLIDAKINETKTELENEIQQIELGNVKAYDPTTGTFENVSQVIMNVYTTFRTNAITCTEFDGLELSATEFDALEITAYDFDINSKTILDVA